MKFFIAHLLNPVPEGITFLGLPTHITIIPPVMNAFRRPPDADVEHLLSSHSPIEVTTGKIGFFGPNEDIAVRLIKAPPALYSLQKSLAEIINAPQTKWPFSPHVSLIGGSPPARQCLCIDSLSIIEKSSDDSPWRLAKNFQLSKKP